MIRLGLGRQAKSRTVVCTSDSVEGKEHTRFDEMSKEVSEVMLGIVGIGVTVLQPR